MVFYNPPKRLQQARQPDMKASIMELPDELLLKILDSALPTTNIISLRATCSNIVPVCNEVLKQRMKVLYIHPSRASLRAAVNICNHPVFRTEIVKVVLLGEVPWTQIEKAYPKHRTHGPIYSNHSRFRAWPANLPVEIQPSSKRGESGVVQTAHEPDTFPSAYGVLIDALAALKKATKLEFAQSVKEAGWNRVSQAVMDSHAFKIASSDEGRRDGAVRQAQTMGTKSGKGPLRFADSDVFYGLLLHPALHFTEIRLDTELPFINDTLKRVQYESLLDCSIPGMKHLTSIELAIDLGWPHTGFHSLYRTLIHHSRETLERLQIVLVPNAYVKSAKEDGTLGRVLEQVICPSLKRLELKLGPLTTRDLNKRYGTQRKPRPTCQTFEILPFLCEHARLTHIDFTNITFDSIEISTLIPLLIEPTTRPQHLEHFSWTVNRYTHDPRCKRSNDEPTMACRKFECGRYHSGNVASGREMWVGQMDVLALRMGVDLGDDLRSWDFGEVVVRGEGWIEGGNRGDERML